MNMIIDGILAGIMFIFIPLGIGSCATGNKFWTLVNWGVVVICFIVGIINIGIGCSKNND